MKKNCKPKKGYAEGGMIRGPGTGTSDSIDREMPEGSYVMPADSTQSIGPAMLQGLAEEAENIGEDVPVSVSNGEFEFTPDQIYGIGLMVVEQMRNMTHQPKGEAPKGERVQLASGGVVSKDQRLHLSSGGVTSEEERNKNLPDGVQRVGNSYSDAPKVPTVPAAGTKAADTANTPTVPNTPADPAKPVTAASNPIVQSAMNQAPQEQPRGYFHDTVGTIKDTWNETKHAYNQSGVGAALGTAINVGRAIPAGIAVDAYHNAANNIGGVLKGAANFGAALIGNEAPYPSPPTPATQSATEATKSATEAKANAAKDPAAIAKSAYGQTGGQGNSLTGGALAPANNLNRLESAQAQTTNQITRVGNSYSADGPVAGDIRINGREGRGAVNAIMPPGAVARSTTQGETMLRAAMDAAAARGDFAALRGIGAISGGQQSPLAGSQVAPAREAPQLSKYQQEMQLANIMHQVERSGVPRRQQADMIKSLFATQMGAHQEAGQNYRAGLNADSNIAQEQLRQQGGLEQARLREEAANYRNEDNNTSEDIRSQRAAQQAYQQMMNDNLSKIGEHAKQGIIVDLMKTMSNPKASEADQTRAANLYASLNGRPTQAPQQQNLLTVGYGQALYDPVSKQWITPPNQQP